MAGTRLLIVISFIGPFVCWAIVSFYAGIYRKNDLLLYRIFPKRGKIALKASKKGATFEKLYIEPLNVIANEANIQFWKETFREFFSDDRIQVIGTNSINDLSAICDDPSIDIASKEDLWICETQTQTEEKTRLVLLQNTAALYTTTPTAHRALDLSTMFPTASSYSCPISLKISVLIDEKLIHWKESMNIASQWFQSKDFWPCYKNVELDFQVTDITNAGSQDDESPNLFLLSSTLVSEKMFGNVNDKRSQRLAVIFVTDQPSVLVDDDGGRAALAAFGDHVFQMASTTLGIETALDTLSNILFSRCLGIPDNLENFDLVAIEMKGNNKTIPSFYEKLWMHRTVLSYYNAVTTKASTVRQTLLLAPNGVNVPASYAQTFFQACDWINHARELAAEAGDYLSAISYLEESDRRLTDVLQDPALAIPADFPMEQYAAIFAPLLFPLLVPLLATLLREYKRYRKLLVQKQKDGS
jgi:hypothetical protein